MTQGTVSAPPLPDPEPPAPASFNVQLDAALVCIANAKDGHDRLALAAQRAIEERDKALQALIAAQHSFDDIVKTLRTRHGVTGTPWGFGEPKP